MQRLVVYENEHLSSYGKALSMPQDSIMFRNIGSEKQRFRILCLQRKKDTFTVEAEFKSKREPTFGYNRFVINYKTRKAGYTIEYNGDKGTTATACHIPTRLSLLLLLLLLLLIIDSCI